MEALLYYVSKIFANIPSNFSIFAVEMDFTHTNMTSSFVRSHATGNALGFSQLKSFGGFEMMRCQPNCRDLSVINCSWNAKDLRSNMGGGQGKIYLRPIQKSLSTGPILTESRSEVKEKCYMCDQEILVHKLRELSKEL